MPGLFPINTVLTQGRRNQTVALDPANGSQVTATLADSVTPALKGAAQYSFYPPGLLSDQEVWSRQLLLGTTTGSVTLSCDSGATWTETILDAASSVDAVAIGEASTPEYPHAYAGLATGVLWAYTESHDAAGGGLWTAIAPSTLSAITALALPTGGYGACWVGCLDGSLWRYTPSLGLVCVAQLPGAITALAHLHDPSVVYGLCADASLRLFMAMEGGVEAAIFCLDKTQSYSGLAAAGTRALVAAGASSLLWSPDAGASWGTLAAPAAGPFAVALPAHDDHNEVVVLTAAGALSTSLDNGATWTARTVPGAITAIEADKHHPGVYYAIGGGAFYVSYDRGASWDTVVAAGVACAASGALCHLAVYSYRIAVLDGSDGSGVGDGFTLLAADGAVVAPLVDHLFAHVGDRNWTNGLVWVSNPATGSPELWTVGNTSYFIYRWDARTLTYIGTFPLPFSPNSLYQVSFMRNDGPAGRVWVSNGAGEAYRFNLDGTQQGGVIHFPNWGTPNYSARPIQVGNQIWVPVASDGFATIPSVVFRLDYTGARAAADLTGNGLTNVGGKALVVGTEAWVYGWGYPASGPLSRWNFDGSIPGSPYALSAALNAADPTLEAVGAHLLALYNAPGARANDGELYAVGGTSSSAVPNGSGVNDPLGVASYPPAMTAPALSAPANGATSANPAVLSWTASANATSHEVQVSTDGTFATLTIACATVLGTTYTTPALAAATTYSWRVRGLYDVHGGPWSVTRTFVTP